MDSQRGKYIKKRRQDLNISQGELAKKIKTTQAQISKWENGQLPTFDNIEKLSVALDVPLSVFITKAGYTEFSTGDINQYTEPSPPSNLKQLVKEAVKEILGEKQNIPNNLSPVLYTDKTIRYPILSGRASCGNLSVITEDIIEDWIDLPETYRVKADFVLQAKGDCLEQEKIFDGYLVFVRKQEFCESGDIVAVRVIENDEGHAILKKAKILNNGGIIFTSGLGNIIELKEDMEIVGKAVYWMPDPRSFC
jgi:SOS-response transcriptional repressor LexA